MHVFFGDGVVKAENAGVKELAVDLLEKVGGDEALGGGQFAHLAVSTTIFRVAEDRVSKMRQMDANLMSASSLKSQRKMSEKIELGNLFTMRTSFLTFISDCVFLAVVRVAANGKVD